MTLKTTGNAAHAPSFLCCLFLFCFFPAGAQAQPAVCHLPAGFQSISTLACTSVLTDPDHRYTAAKAFEALSEGKFVPYTTPGNILKQRKAQATWLSFSIHNQTGDTLDLIFLFKDLKEAWRIDERNLKKIPHAGHHVVYDVSGLLTLPERMFFTYQLPPASSETFLCLSDYPLPNKSIAPEVFEIRSFERAKNKELRFVTLFNGMIFGAGLMVVFMSLIFYWQVRDRILPAYALYIFVFLVYLWRDFEYMNLQFFSTLGSVRWFYTKSLLPAAISWSYMIFIRRLLDIPVHFQTVGKILNASAVLVLVCLLLDVILINYSFAWSYAFSPHIMSVLLFLTLLPVSFHFLKSGEVVAKFVAVGSFFLVVGGVSISLLPVHIHSWVVRATFLLELCCFTAAIGYKSRLLLHQKRQVEKELSEKAARHQWELETQIAVEKAIVTERLRTRIAQDIHDEVGSSLTKISLSAQVAARLPDLSATELKARMEKLGADARHAAGHLREIVFAINPDFDRFVEMQAYFRENAREFWNGTNVKAHYIFETNESNPTVPPDVKRQLLLVFKEAQNNVAKHAGASEVWLTFQMTSPDRYLLEVRDNGRGFVVSNNNGFVQGLSGIKKRTDSIGATLSIESELGNGTVVRVDGSMLL